MKQDLTTLTTTDRRKAQAMTDKLYAWGFWPIHFSRTFKKTGTTRYYIKAVFTPAEAEAAKALFATI